MQESEQARPDGATGLGLIPWTVGDALRAAAVVIGILLVLLVALGLGSVLLIGIDNLLDAGPQNVSDIIDLLKDEGVFNQWLIIMLVGMVLGEGAMPLGAWLFSARKYRCGWQALGLRRFNVKRGVMLALAVVAAGVLISYLYDLLMQALGVETSSSIPVEFTESGLGLGITAFTAVVVAPLAEEVSFRGFLFPAIGKRWGYGWGAIISAAIFSIAHLQPGALVPIFILGLLLARLYMVTGSIWPCIITHAVYNSIALIFMLYY